MRASLAFVNRIGTVALKTMISGKARMPIQNPLVRTLSIYSRQATKPILRIIGSTNGTDENFVQGRLAQVKAPYLHFAQNRRQYLLCVSILLQQ